MTKNRVGGLATAIAVSTLLFAHSEAEARKSDKLLEYIPADTPYVFATTKPMPDKVADKLEPAFDAVLQTYQRMFREIMAEKLVTMSATEGGADEAEQFRGFMEEVIGLLSIDGIRSLGIERDSAFALYGNGLIPVLRLELSDTQLFDVAVSRLEEKSGHAFKIGEVDDNSYKYADIGVARLIIATFDDQAVITAVPSKFDEAQVALALGIDKPRNNLKKRKTIRAINKEYGFSNFMTGYFDNARLANIFMGGASALDRELFASLEFEVPELSDVCKSEILALVNVAPRVVVGYTSLTVDEIDGKMVIDMREDIAEGLAELTAAVPGLGADPGGLMSIGFSINPLKAREFYIARLDAMEANPFKCESLAGFQKDVAEGREALNQPIPPMVYGFRGFVANVMDLKGMDMASNQPPESVDATVLVAIENAEALLMMGAMIDPEIASLNLLPDGKPVRLDLPQFATIADDVFAALTENAMSISLGEGAEKNAEEILQADSADPAPFLSISMDSARYYSMIADAIMTDEPTEEGSQAPLAMREAMRDLMIATGRVYERVAATVRFTDQGVVVESRASLAD